MKKNKVFKNFIPIAGICLVAGFFIALLGFLNYKNNMLNIQTNQGKQVANFLNNFVDSIKMDLKTEQIVPLVDILRGTSRILVNDEAEFFFYDKEEDMMYGETVASKNHADDAMAESGFNEIILDNIHYIPVECTDTTYLIAAYDVTNLIDTLNTIIPNYAKWFGISFGMLCLVFLLIGLISKKKRVGKRVACVLVSLWMMSLATYLAVYTGLFYFSQYGKNRECILMDLEEDIQRANEYTAQEIIAQLAIINEFIDDEHITFNFLDVFDEEGNINVPEEELRRAYIDLNVKYYVNFSNFFSEIQVKDNIFDETVPIEDRVNLKTDWNYISNCFIAYLLQILMLGSLAIVLIIEIYYYEEERMLKYAAKEKSESQVKIHIDSEKPHAARVPFRNVRRFINRYSRADRVKLLLTILQVAEALVTAVSVVMLRSMIMDQYPVNGGTFITIVIAAEGIICAGGIFLYPAIIRLCKTDVGLTRFTTLLCIVGAAFCYVSGSCWLYVVGFILVNFGSAFAKSLLYLNVGGEENIKGVISNIVSIARGMSVGTLIGFVVSSVISTIINDRTIFLVAFVLYAVMMMLTLGHKKESRPLEAVNIGKLFSAFKTVDLWVYMILMIIPVGMVDYFIKYRIPLDIAALGLTTALVSFLYYLRSILILIFKYKKMGKPLYKVNSQIGAVIMSLAYAAIIIGYCLIRHFIALIIAVILIAYLKAFFNDTYHADTVSIDTTDIVDGSGFNMVCKGAKKLSSTAASFLTDAFGFISLGFIIAGTSVVYLGYYLLRKRVNGDGSH